MGHFVRMVEAIRKANAEFALGLGAVLSWPVWLPLILLCSFAGWMFRESDLLVLVLTIQTAVDSAATKMLQNHVRSKDVERESRMESILTEIRAQNEAALIRDKQAAKQTKMILAAVNASNATQAALLDFLRKEGSHRESTRAINSRAKSSGRTDGRRHGKKP